MAASNTASSWHRSSSSPIAFSFLQVVSTTHLSIVEYVHVSTFTAPFVIGAVFLITFLMFLAPNSSLMQQPFAQDLLARDQVSATDKLRFHKARLAPRAKI
jgi:hypothetical protein